MLSGISFSTGLSGLSRQLLGGDNSNISSIVINSGILLDGRCDAGKGEAVNAREGFSVCGVGVSGVGVSGVGVCAVGGVKIVSSVLPVCEIADGLRLGGDIRVTVGNISSFWLVACGGEGVFTLTDPSQSSWILRDTRRDLGLGSRTGTLPGPFSSTLSGLTGSPGVGSLVTNSVQASTEDCLCFFRCTCECFFLLFRSPRCRGSGVDSGVVSCVSVSALCRDGREVGVVNLSPGVTGRTDASLCRTVLAFERGLRLRSTGGGASRGGRGSESILTRNDWRNKQCNMITRENEELIQSTVKEQPYNTNTLC